MTIEEAITQLEDLREDREGFLENDESNGVFAQDIEALTIAIGILKSNAKEVNRHVTPNL